MAKSSQRMATVIGSRGFIGTHLLARLQRDGWSCWVPQRDDPQLCRRDLGHVFYCAGLTADYDERPHDAVEAHVSLLSRVLRDACYESLIYLSSTRLYDSLGGEKDAAAVETLSLRLSPHDPRHLYDLSKALGESLCRVTGRGQACVARLSCVWGESEDATGFLPELIRRVRDARELSERPSTIMIDSSPHFIRDYVYIDETVEALIALASPRRSAGFGIYNVAGGRSVSNAELFDCVSTASGYSVVAAHDRLAPPLPRLSISRMTDELGWRPVDTLLRLSQIIEKQRI